MNIYRSFNGYTSSLASTQGRYDLYKQLYETLDVRLSPEFDTGHIGSVNTLSIESVSRRFMISGGGDSSLKIWDLESSTANPGTGDYQIDKVAEVPRKQGHEYGISAAKWWAHDNGMFVTSSFDTTVKIWDSNTLQDAYTFKMNHRIYTISLSQCEGNSLVATATDHPLIRLLDLRTTSSSHTLTGHSGTVLAVEWSPTDPNILASGGSDGTVRLWDIRRSSACLTSFDMQQTNSETQSRIPFGLKKAHRSSVNGLCWFPSGDYLISSGNDEKIRLWSLSAVGGKNMLVNFGPLIRNRHIQNLNPCLSPRGHLREPYLFFPSDSGEILMFRAIDGKIVKRLSRSTLTSSSLSSSSRSACMVARGGNDLEFYSGALDGSITCWCPKASTDIYGDPELDDELEMLGDYT